MRGGFVGRRYGVRARRAGWWLPPACFQHHRGRPAPSLVRDRHARCGRHPGGVLLSIAQMFGSPARTVEDEYAKVRQEYDWTAAPAALRSTDRVLALLVRLREIETALRNRNRIGF
jgi:hypothetical protein